MDRLHYENVPFEVPESWEWCRLGEICQIKGGKRIPLGKTFSPAKTNHIYIRVTDMKKNTILADELKYIDDDIFEAIKNYTIGKDDLYLTIAGTIGAVGIVPPMFDGMSLTENAVKLTSISIDKYYLLYCLSSQFVQEQFSSRFHQVAQPKLSIETSLKTLLAIPPLQEQQRIVQKIKECFTLIDQIEESKLSLSQFIKQTKSKVLDLAIRGKLVPQNPNDEPVKIENKTADISRNSQNEQFEEIPNNWIVCKLSDICVFERGITFPASAKQSTELSNSIACVRTANVQEKLELDDLWYIDKSYIKNNTNKLLQQNDIILSSANSKELVGKTAFVEDAQREMTFGGFVMVIRTFEADSKFLFYFLRNCFYKGLFAKNSTQTTNIANINTTILSEIEIPFPPLAEQKRIVQKIESIFQTLDSIQNNL